jgi:hypothetical protein
MKLVQIGNTLSLFFAISFTVCVLWGLATPVAMHMHEAWAPLMPGFHWISVPAFLIGLAWSFAYGWYAAILFVVLYNFFDVKKPA